MAQLKLRPGYAGCSGASLTPAPGQVHLISLEGGAPTPSSHSGSQVSRGKLRPGCTQGGGGLGGWKDPAWPGTAPRSLTCSPGSVSLSILCSCVCGAGGSGRWDSGWAEATPLDQATPRRIGHALSGTYWLSKWQGTDGVQSGQWQQVSAPGVGRA